MTSFKIGPDESGDVRKARPYFLIPLLDSNDAHGRLVRYLMKETFADNPFTDVYLISHGWHRNFFGAVAAYDRLVSRFAVLYQRGRLVSEGQIYRPLFLAMHWNSDPKPDGWIDEAGRRDKSRFLQKASALLEPEKDISEGSFINTLENAYQFMTFVSAPDVQTLDTAIDDKAKKLFTQVSETCAVRGRLTTNPPLGAEDKVSLLWRCYVETEPQRVLMDQPERPRRFSNPLGAISNLLKFLVAVLVCMTVLGLVPKIVGFFGLTKPFMELERYMSTIFWAWSWSHGLSSRATFFEGLWLVAVLTVVAMLILGGTVTWQKIFRKGKSARGLPVLAVGSWLPLQVLFLSPLLLYLFATFLFRTGIVLLAPLVYLVGEYLGTGRCWPVCLFLLACAVFSFLTEHVPALNWSLSREHLPEKQTDLPCGIADDLAKFALIPLSWLRKSVAADSRVVLLATALEKQLSFWRMQRKAIQASQAAGKFVEDVWAELKRKNSPVLQSARLHLIGHSFGGLVMANMAEFLFSRKSKDPLLVHSLILLQAALASGWFETKAWIQNKRKLQGVLACIYSAYDMATGFYYPALNGRQEAAGYVGLCAFGNRKDTPKTLGKDDLLASLVQPPDLRNCFSKDDARPYILNLDASRLIYEGFPATGGGHDDVYKDDVIHMLWAITQL